MARVSFPTKEIGVDAVTFMGRYRLGRLQSANFGAQLPTTPINEIGSNRTVGNAFDQPDVTASVQGILTTARTPFILAGRDWATAPAGDFVEVQDFKYVTLLATFKDETTLDVKRTAVIPAAKVSSIRYNFSVNGDSTEEYSFSASDRLFLRYDAIISSGTVSGGSVTMTSSLQLQNGNYYICVFASGSTGVGYVPANAITGSTATTVTFNTTEIPNTSRALVISHANAANAWDYTYNYPNVKYGYTPGPDQPITIRGPEVEVYLAKGNPITSSGRIYRAQTCTINVNYPTTRVSELGSTAVVGYADGIPTVNGTLDILHHDFSLLQSFHDDDAGSQNDWQAADMGELTNIGLLIQCWERGVNRTSGTPEATLWIPKIDISNEQTTIPVNDSATETFDFTSRDGRLYIYKGLRLSTASF